MLHRLYRNLLLSIALGAIVFLSLSVFSDLDRLTEAFRRFDARYIAAALGLALVNYLVRFVRWHLYLRLLRIPLAWRDSSAIFTAGLVMSVTPGKAGELLKAYFVRHRVGTPVSVSAPVVVAERLTDFISLIILGLMGILTSREAVSSLLGLLVGIGIILLLLARREVVEVRLKALGRVPVVSRLAGPLARAYEGVRLLVAPVHLVWAVALGTSAWFAECLAFHLVLVGFGVAVGLVQATFIYSTATVFGALTMLPGGLGLTEASMSGILVLREVPLPDAVGATMVTRVCTLWFAVALGAGVLLRCGKQLGGERALRAEHSTGQGVKGE